MNSVVLKLPILLSVRFIVYCQSDGEQRPSIESLMPTAEETKLYWARWELLSMVNGVLYRRFVDAEGRTKKLQLITPAVLRPELIRRCHTGITGGHLGFRKTVA